MHVKSTIANIDFVSHKLSLQDLSCMSSQQEIRHKFDLDRGKGRNVVLEQLDKCKCRPGAAGHVEMSSWSR